VAPGQSPRQTSCNMVAGLRLPVVRFAEPLERTESHLDASDIRRGWAQRRSVKDGVSPSQFARSCSGARGARALLRGSRGAAGHRSVRERRRAASGASRAGISAREAERCASAPVRGSCVARWLQRSEPLRHSIEAFEHSTCLQHMPHCIPTPRTESTSNFHSTRGQPTMQYLQNFGFSRSAQIACFALIAGTHEMSLMHCCGWKST
jgi:hypothetical protein